MKKNKKRKGFTIVELIIVMAIIAILILMSVPTFKKYLEYANDTSELATASALYKSSAATVLTESLKGKVSYAGLSNDILDGVSGELDVFTYMYRNDTQGVDVGDNRNVYPDKWWIYFLIDEKSFVIPTGDIYIIAPSGKVYKNGIYDPEMTAELDFV